MQTPKRCPTQESIATPMASVETLAALKILVVGCGLVGQHYCRCLKQIGAEVSAVCDPDPARRRTAAGIGGGREFADYRDALTTATPDVVCVCTPTPSHFAITMDAAAAGCNVFVEKPLAETTDEAAEMVRAMTASGKSLGFGLKMRFEAVFLKAWQRIAAGEIGKPGEVVITYNQNLPPPDRAWYLEEGVILGSMPHPFDLSYWWLGQEPEWLWADTGNRLGFKGEDRALAVIGYADGGRAMIEMAYQSRFPEVATRDDMLFQIIGDCGHLQGDRSGVLQSVTREGKKRDVIAAVDGFKAEIRAFLHAILANRPPPVAGLDGLRIQKMIAAARRSASTGARVMIG